jgi:farnesyl-diphosphate farnesyltransferase
MRFEAAVDGFISHHLHGVSRTYAIVIPMLPRPLDEAVGLAYLLMRIVDTLEDAPELNETDRRSRLLELERALGGDEPGPEVARPAGDKPAERALMADAPEVLRRVARLDGEYAAAAHTCARTMIHGVLEMQTRAAARGLPYPANADAAELRRYCYYVAGAVGEMLCVMMAHYLKYPALLRLRDVAVELGIGLQLVNILKDALADSRTGRRYLPLAESGRVDAGEIYRAVLQEARASLARGVDFVLALPAAAGGLRLFCGLPIAWGAMTLQRAERDAAKAKIDRGRIVRTIDRFRALVADDSALRAWLREMLQSPSRAPA